MNQPVQMDKPAPLMTVEQFRQWHERQRLAFPREWRAAWPVKPGDRIAVTMTGDRSHHSILIVDDQPLTPRQLEVIRAAEQGEDPHATARRLWLSWQTIRWHRKTAYKRLGVTSMPAAITRARELGIL